MLLGYFAEYKLRRMWFENHPDVSKYLKYDNHDREKKGDLLIVYKGREFVIECKSLQTNSIKREAGQWTGKAQCDASDRRTVTLKDGSTLETTCLLVGEFDLLAVNLFAFEEKWRFVFVKNSELPRSRYRKYTEAQRKELLASLVTVSWLPEAPFRDEPFSHLDELLSEPH